MSVIVADRRNVTDGSAAQFLEQVKSNIPIVLVAWSHNFKFNYDAVKDLKDYCLVCYCEYGWDVSFEESHIWGVNSEKFPRYYTGDWVRFDDWVKANPPKLFLKRELLKKDVTDKIKPIEYPARYAAQGIPTREQFNGRPIQAMMYWGRSNERRLSIHGGIWLNARRKGYSVLDNIYYFDNFMLKEDGIKWATFHIPYYSRVPMDELMTLNGFAKIGLSPKGAGYKCFRETEVPVNSVLCLHESDMAYSFDWIHNENCIKMPIGISDDAHEEIDAIEKALKNENLYDIFVNGVRNVEKYMWANYIKFIEDTINNA